MAHLDLEEQEQLDQIKHFWKQYGNLITNLALAVLLAVAGWNGWQYWQRGEATKAAAMYDEFERVARSGDLTRLDRALGDIKDKYASHLYAHQAAMLAAKLYTDAGKTAEAQAALRWVADKAGDEGYQSLAKLRLAGLQLDAKAYDDALKTLSGKFPASFEPLADDRRGDVYLAQGQKPQAIEAFNKAFKAMDERTDYRRIVEVKLIALGAAPEVKAEPKSEAAK